VGESAQILHGLNPTVGVADAQLAEQLAPFLLLALRELVRTLDGRRGSRRLRSLTTTFFSATTTGGATTTGAYTGRTGAVVQDGTKGVPRS